MSHFLEKGETQRREEHRRQDGGHAGVGVTYFDWDGSWRHRSELGNVGSLHRRASGGHILQQTEYLGNAAVTSHALMRTEASGMESTL